MRNIIEECRFKYFLFCIVADLTYLCIRNEMCINGQYKGIFMHDEDKMKKNHRSILTRLYPVWDFIGHNKYWIVVIGGILLVGIVDENSILQQVRNGMLIDDLKTQIEEYNSQYENDERQLKALKNDPKAVTKVAREKYFMKADDEDIFVLSDDEGQQTEK